MSIYEETTISTLIPMMGVFNNLVILTRTSSNRLDNMIPDLAESWSSNDDGKDLTLELRGGVKWHDGKPFTAHDVKCSWDCCSEREKINFGSTRAKHHQAVNLREVTVDDEYRSLFI